MIEWIRKNSLSIIFFCLFAASLAGQSASGFHSYNEKLGTHHFPKIGYMRYLGTGDFLDGIFTNWQAAFLQLGCLIIFGEVLHQKGASHSRKLEEGSRKKEEGKEHSWVYRNSLSLAFGISFALFFLAHLFLGTISYNETRALNGQSPVSTAAYFIDGTFWFKTLQTWQAEFAAIGVFIVLSIFLRQQGSAESKPVDSSDEETGETNK